MSIKIGSNDINKLYNGSTEANKIAVGTEEIPVGPTTEPDYFCFEAADTGYFMFVGSTAEVTINELYYKIDNGEWQDYELGTVMDVSAGQKIYWKGNNPTFSTSPINYIQFVATNVSGGLQGYCSGNIMSLLDETCQSKVIPCDYCFFNLFGPFDFDGTGEYMIPCGIITPPKLPATTLTDYCYTCMFQGCTLLTSVPELPANTLLEGDYGGCYDAMFTSCTSLQVSDSQTTEASHEWKIPSSGTFINETTHWGMFEECLGTRSSDDLAAVAGQSKTYYTQNEPV